MSLCESASAGSTPDWSNSTPLTPPSLVTTADRASTRSSSLNASGTLSASSEKLGGDIRPSTLTGFSFDPGVAIAAIIAASESGARWPRNGTAPR